MLRIKDFCNMQEFEAIMSNWSKSTGLATVAVGEDGKYISGCYNFTDFCIKLTRGCEKGRERCEKCDQEGTGIYSCHAGLIDFAIPIALNDGTVLGSIIGGQVLSEHPEEADFRKTARELGIDEDTYIHALQKVTVKTREEIEASAQLLGDVINMFVRTSYAEKRNREIVNELKSAAAKDRIWTEITKMLYSFNMTLNLRTGKYSLIVGTGLNGYVQLLKSTNDYAAIFEQKMKYVAPEFAERFYALTSYEALQAHIHESGFIGSLEYASNMEKNREWHEINVFMGINEKGEPVANILGRDITEAHDRAETLAQLEIAKEANAAKSMFLSNMSHDIRTPINGIMGMLTRANKHMQEHDVLKDSLDKIRMSSEHLLSLINDVLDISKLEAGKMEFAHEKFSMKSLLNTSCSIAQGQLEGSNIAFITDFSRISHEYAVGSELHIRQILLNILGNAVKYTMEGEIRFTVSEIAADEEKARYRFSVKDTGIGMSEEFLAHIFDAFSQENSSDARTKYVGTGLGMSIVKRMVNEMGGTIEVESTLDEGSTFTVELELPIAVKGQLQEPDEPMDISVDTSGIKVLLVEDNELNMEFEKEILQDAGCIVSEAENGKIALDMFINSVPGTYDMILMDVMMPVMNGIDASKEIRRSGHPEAKDIPIIAQTANAFAEDIQAVKLAGMNEHVSKPIDMDELLRVMSKYRRGFH
uniref:PocR ligand-binding domain-containing protein n=1 Tax=Agathobacter sp. TaxID=2021311 RepID=UPI0040567907